MSNTPKEVFVSYHTSSSAEVVKKLVDALEAMDISCWYAPRNVEGRYASSIMRAINECKVFLIVLNEGSNMSEHVMNEVEAAFNRFSKHEDIELLPFRIDEVELNLDLKYYLSRIHIMDGGIPPAVLKVKELIDRIHNILGKEMVKEGTIEEKNYRLIGAMEYPDNCFVGRRKEIHYMANQFCSHHNKLFLVGMGGIGKSEIAKKYCDEYRDQYDVVLWVSYNTDLCHTIINDFAFQIQGVNRSEHQDMTDEQYFLYKLGILKEIADERVLIIIDNMDVLDDPWLQTFCSGSYNVLFTTRFHALAKNLPELTVDGITEDSELMEIFRAEYEREIDEEDEEEIWDIIHLQNGHPLSIRLVASAMQSGRISPSRMLGLLKKGTATATEEILGRLHQVFTLAALSEEEIYYLKNLSLMPLQGVKVEKIYEYLSFDNFKLNDELVRKSWIVHNPATDEVHLHPLVAELMLNELEKDLSACDKLLESMIAELPTIDDMKFKKKKQAFYCFESVCQKLPKEHTLRGPLVYGYASALVFLGNYEKGIQVARGLMMETEDLELKLKSCNRIAKVYNDLACPEEAIAQATYGLDLVKGIPEEELPGKSGAMKHNMHIRMAEAFRTLEEFDKAEDYMRKALAASHIYYDGTPEVEWAWNGISLARILSRKTDEASYDEAEEILEEVIRIFTDLGNTRGQGFAYTFLSQNSMQQKRFDEAIEEIDKAYKLLKMHLGEVHLNIAITHQYKGNIYRAMGEEEQALIWYRKAREILKELHERKLVAKIDEIVESGIVGYIN